MEPYIQIANSRGGKALIIGNYRYLSNKVRERSNRNYWRCARRGCRVYLTTNNFNVEADDPQIEIVNAPGQHGHEEEADLVATTALIEQMLLLVAADPSQPSRRIYDQILAQAHDVAAMPPFDAVRSRLERKRASLRPPIPRTLEEVVVEGEWAVSWGGDDFLSKHNIRHGYLVFGTEENFRKLALCRQIYMDGTFKTCPRPFYQFVTVHGLYLGRAVPFCMVLMSGKTQEMYGSVLRHIKRKVRRVTGQGWMPDKVVTDFEMAAMNALRAELPGVRTTGCYFHFCQSLWRKIQDIGLSAPYRHNQVLKGWLRKVMSIGFLPLPVVRQNFLLMSTSREARQLRRVHPELDDFIQYMDNTYVGPNATFPPIIWNVYGRSSDNRTNNRVEGFHHRWNASMDRQHPSIWVFIRRLKDEQRLVESVCGMADRGDRAPLQRRKWRELEERLQRLRAQYERGDRTVELYWDAVQHLIVNFEV